MRVIYVSRGGRGNEIFVVCWVDGGVGDYGICEVGFLYMLQSDSYLTD